MNRLLTVSVLLLMTLFSASAQSTTQTDKGVKINAADGKLRCEIIFYTPSIVRIVKYPEDRMELPQKESLSVVLNPQKTEFSYREQGNNISLATSCMTVVMDKTTGNIHFSSSKGKNLLKEKMAGFEKRQEGMDKGAYIVNQLWALDKDEPIYGLGIMQDGKMNRRNTSRYMVQNNTEDFVTFFQSLKGYGIFWDNYSPTDFADTPEGTLFKSEVGDCIDYYFMVGGNADGVVAQMRQLTGEVPMFPLWTYGFWQSRERYKTQQELLEVVSKYRELNVPLDGIIQDWQYWGNNYQWNAMEFLNTEFPNPQEMVDKVHGQNAHLMISIWSSFGPMTKQYRELNQKGLLFNFQTWPQSGLETWPPRMDYPSGVRVYDAYSSEARDIYWKNLKRLHDLKIDAWWMDSTEPDHLDFKPEDFETKTSMGSFRKVRNAYPLVTVGGVYDRQRATSSDKRVFILTRSTFAGQQRYGANVWSGDVGSSWEILRNQIPAGLNFTLTGNPNFNTDIGGFFAGAYNNSWNDGSASRNPLYRELYVRWLQFGLFNPVMRSHGTETPREIYYFGKKGEPIYDAIEDAIRFRYVLLPYIYSTSWQVTNNRSSFMRALAMDFADDKKVWDMNHEFMFGNSLLVAPIVKAQYTPEKIVSVDEMSGWDKKVSQPDDKKTSMVDFTTKKSTQIYLPKGTEWYDFWTNKKYKGGREITRETTIDCIPLYVRAGSVLPIGAEVQYATEKKWDNLEIRVYPGADGEFVLYEDEFDNYNYEKGAYTTIPFKWDNAKRQLTIGDREGKYNGMLDHRKFTIILMAGEPAIGDNNIDNGKVIDYAGQKVTMNF